MTFNLNCGASPQEIMMMKKCINDNISDIENVEDGLDALEDEIAARVPEPWSVCENITITDDTFTVNLTGDECEIRVKPMGTVSLSAGAIVLYWSDGTHELSKTLNSFASPARYDNIIKIYKTGLGYECKYIVNYTSATYETNSFQFVTNNVLTKVEITSANAFKNIPTEDYKVVER